MKHLDLHQMLRSTLLRKGISLLLVGVLSILVFSACGEVDANPGASRATINGKHADIYFDRFLVRKAPDGKFHYLTNFNRVELETTAEDQASDRAQGVEQIRRYAEINLFLSPNKEYFLSYREYRLTAEKLFYEDEEEILKRGLWSVDGADLVLEGLARGTGERIEGQDMLFLVFDFDLLHSGLKGIKVYFSQAESNENPIDRLLENHPEEKDRVF